MDVPAFELDAGGVAQNYRANTVLADALYRRGEQMMDDDAAGNALEAIKLFVRACVLGCQDWPLREAMWELCEQLQGRFITQQLPPHWRERYWLTAELLAPHVILSDAPPDTPYGKLFDQQPVIGF